MIWSRKIIAVLEARVLNQCKLKEPSSRLDNMKHKIENLIRATEHELGNVTLEVASGRESNELVLYWATRLKTLKQVIDLIEQEENEVIH